MIATTDKRHSFTEFVILLSLMMALTALSIDAMLPALPQIGSDLQVPEPNDRQLVISMIFLGLALGQLFFGPLSDSTGRKPAIYGGFGLFIVGSLLSMLSTTFPMMLVGRLLQGMGASSPRAVSLALVRDQFAGRAMARVMAYLMVSFFCVGVLFGNLNSLAMEPLGQVAGIGAAVVGALSTLISVLLGTVIGQSYNGTILPLVAGLALLAGLSRVVVRWIDGPRRPLVVAADD